MVVRWASKERNNAMSFDNGSGARRVLGYHWTTRSEQLKTPSHTAIEDTQGNYETAKSVYSLYTQH